MKDEWERLMAMQQNQRSGEDVTVADLRRLVDVAIEARWSYWSLGQSIELTTFWLPLRDLLKTLEEASWLNDGRPDPTRTTSDARSK